MIKLTPKPNYKYLRISDNTVCEGAVYLGIFDKIENYKLITDEEAIAIKKKQRQEETKEVIIMSVIIFATVMSFFIHTDNDEDRQ